MKPTIFIFFLSSSSSFSSLPLFPTRPYFFFTLLQPDVNKDVAFGYSPRYSGTSFYKEWLAPSYFKLFPERVETQRSKTWTYFNFRSIYILRSFFTNKRIVSCIVGRELNFYKNKKKKSLNYIKLKELT